MIHLLQLASMIENLDLLEGILKRLYSEAREFGYESEEAEFLVIEIETAFGIEMECQLQVERIIACIKKGTVTAILNYERLRREGYED